MLKNHGGRIMGIETEYGLLLPENKNLDGLIQDIQWRAPGFIGNGSRIYVDMEHLEYSTPERRSFREIIIADKAGELLCQKYLSPKYNAVLVKNNVDKDFEKNEGRKNLHTFGCHENYLVGADKSKLYYYITPFLIARTIMTGSGFLNEEGQYSLSQREKFMDFHISKCTTSGRGIINTARDDEPLAECRKKYRFHLICGDANMCEDAIALKIGATELMISLIEDGLFPVIYYDYNKTVNDLRGVSAKTSDWRLEGMQKGSKFAVDFLNLCEERAREVYYGSNSETDALLDLWKNVNSGLASINTNPYYLFGKLDWTTKLFLLRDYALADSLDFSDIRVQSNDIQYHRVDGESLFYQAQKAGLIERIVSDEEIIDATINPPNDTRASFRGRALKLFEFLEDKSNRNGLEIRTDWDWIGIFDLRDKEKMIWERRLPDPTETYDKYLIELSYFLNKRL